MSPVWILLTLLPILGGAERFNCKGRILGAYYADAKSGCKAFHVCVRVAGGGIRDFRFFCPPGTLFHQEAQTCTDWGDDDPLACPADIYDGQFDLYRIGSGFDTKKLSNNGNRDDEAEFGLQRAETGDRRLSQNNVAPNRPDSDLRAAHSSDFFSGQRDRGRDEPAAVSPVAQASPSPSPQYHSRQSFRRPTQRTTTTQYSTPSSPSLPSSPPHNEGGSKRKLVRKRPIYVSTKAPTTTTTTTPIPTTTPQQNYPTTQVPQQQFNTQNNVNNNQQKFNPQQNLNNQRQKFNNQKQNFNNQQQNLNYEQQNLNNQLQNSNNQQTNYNNQPNFNGQQNFNRRVPSQNKLSYSTTPNVPIQYREFRDEYVEVSRVTPKPNRYYPNGPPSSTGFPQSTNAPRYNNNKDSLVELYNYDAQSTPALNVRNDNRPFKVKNSFSVADVPRDSEFARANNFNVANTRELSTTVDNSRGLPTTTAAYKNFNSVSYEPEKNNFVTYTKQNNFNNYPTTTIAPITTIYTTSRPEPPPNLNTVAYNTNIGFQAQSNNNYPESDEDDGQYHPPEGEDDGQYKPEIYDRELLTGAHSLNIAASGNRLPEDRKTYSKTQSPSKPVAQTAAPRPFRPAPTPTIPPTTRIPEIYTTTVQPQTINTQRTFDYIQTYTTTSRPTDFVGIGQTFAPNNEASIRPTTAVTSRVPETRPPRPVSRAPAPPTQPPTAPPRPTTRPQSFANPVSKKEDSSYDYAYYDSDPGFSEYDHIEEFGKTNKS